MENKNGNTNVSESLFNRESLLKANAALIKNLQNRLNVQRFRPQEGDGIKLAYMRVYLQALQVQNSILKDSELEDFKKRLEALEAAQNPDKNTAYAPAFEAFE